MEKIVIILRYRNVYSEQLKKKIIILRYQNNEKKKIIILRMVTRSQNNGKNCHYSKISEYFLRIVEKKSPLFQLKDINKMNHNLIFNTHVDLI